LLNGESASDTPCIRRWAFLSPEAAALHLVGGASTNLGDGDGGKAP
jgi:hypothetical protein